MSHCSEPFCRDRLVGKAVDFLEVEQAVAQPPENGPAAFRAEIECQKMSAHAKRPKDT